MRMQPRRILCTTDLSEFSNQTLAYGIGLAKAFDAKLFICHVVDLPFATIYGEVHFVPLEIQSQSLESARNQLEALMADATVPWESLVTVGHTADEIQRLAVEHHIDLAISATHGRSGLKRFVLGSVTERMMRALTCPLLVIRDPALPGEGEASQAIRFGRILVGCDFSEDSDAAFRYGLSLAQEFEAELHLVHVLEPPVYTDWLKAGAVPSIDFDLNFQEQASEKLSQMVPSEARHWCSPVVSVLTGRPFAEIVAYASSRRADLIVLGMRGYGLVEALFLGSTTDRVVRHTPCPVLSVCAEGRCSIDVPG
ncbi:MAG: universal stress protein [Desulfobacterales bacterium]|nr:universal stress protein [Desulfobacterales bacterium]